MPGATIERVPPVDRLRVSEFRGGLTDGRGCSIKGLGGTGSGLIEPVGTADNLVFKRLQVPATAG